MLQGLDRARGEHHDQGEAHIGRTQILHDDRRKAQRQSLAAIFDRSGERAPAGLDISAIGFAISRRHLHALRRPARPDLIADPVQRGEFAGGEGSGTVDDRVDDVRTGFGEGVAARQFVQLDDMSEQEFLFVDRRLVAHGVPRKVAKVERAL